MATITVKDIAKFFNPNENVVALTGDKEGQHRAMTPKDMIREWKTCPDNASANERATLLTAADKDVIRKGIEDGTLTY